MPPEVLIQCENLIKIYRLESGISHTGETAEVQALQGLDLTVMRGEMVGVVGASGSGKSTLLNILGGLDRPTGGRVVVNQKDLARISQIELDLYRRETVGFVWQQGSRNLIPYLTALENVQLPLTLSGRLDPQAHERPLELIRLVGLEERKEHRLEELSGGEQQRVAIAIALANAPSLLLADEPTGELDTATAQTIYDLLRELNRRLGLTVIIVSHDTSLAKQVDRLVAVRDGRLASETVRKLVGSSEGGPAHAEKHHLEELLVLDAAGRLQLPREYLTHFHINRRVRLELTPDGILIRPPDKDHGMPEGPASESLLADQPEAAPEFESIAGWRAGVKKPMKAIVNFFQRLPTRRTDKRGSQEDEE